MNKSTIIGVIVVIIIIAGAIYLAVSGSGAGSQVPQDTGVASTSESGASVPTTGMSTSTSAEAPAPQMVTVTYDGHSFSPSTVTIHQGDMVMFTAAAGAGPMWIASNPHPTHQGYDGTTESQHCAPGYAGPAPFDECMAAASFSFTFDKAGTWGYHNHENESVGGTVVVE